MASLASDFENHADASAQDKANLIDKVSENKAESTGPAPASGDDDGKGNGDDDGKGTGDDDGKGNGDDDGKGTGDGSGGVTLGSSKVIEFDEIALKTNRVFGTKGQQAIGYQLQDKNARFITVNLVANNTNTKQFQNIANATYDEGDNEFEDLKGPFSSVNTTHALLENNAKAFSNYYGSEMYIDITWEVTSDDETKSGGSWSTYFTVDAAAGENAEADEANRQALLDKSNEDSMSGFETTTVSGPLPDDTLNPSSADGDEPSESSAPTSSSDESSGGGGGGGGKMSVGATAGAAVGGVVGGLLIISAIVWFLLRRRRQKKFQDDRSGEQTYVVDKETQGGRSTDSPNLGYADGSHTTKPVPLENINHDRDDSAIPRNSLGSRSRGGNSDVQTPQGISSNVAHLVEDGMTADEIRRLEEEERQLDDEIERAARR